MNRQVPDPRLPTLGLGGGMIAVLAALLGVVLVSCAAKPKGRGVVGKTLVPGSREDVIERRMHDLMNDYRRSHGQPGLERDSRLDGMARGHSEFMLRNRSRLALTGKSISHEGFESRILAAQRVFHIMKLSENVVAGRRIHGDVASSLVRGLIDSSGHRHNLLADWKLTGLGVVIDEYGNVWATQLLGLPGSQYSRAANTAPTH